MTQPFKVWDKQSQRMTQYTPKEVYKLVVDYPGTNRQLEFLGMDRGSCIMQAEVAKEEGDTVMLTVSEESVTLLQKQEMKI
jgi:hypothetical protein